MTVDFTRADLTFADLRGVDLRSATGLTPGQIKQAIIDDSTKLPTRLHKLMARDAEDVREEAVCRRPVRPHRVYP